MAVGIVSAAISLGEALVQDVDLFVSFGEVVRFGGAVAVGIGGVMPHLESDLGHPLDDAADSAGSSSSRGW